LLFVCKHARADESLRARRRRKCMSVDTAARGHGVVRIVGKAGDMVGDKKEVFGDDPEAVN